MKKLSVSAIEKGTVIDHIPAKNVMKVAKILGVEGNDDMILIGTNLDSNKLNKKGVVKFANRFLDKKEVNKISLFAPEATIVTIEDYEVQSKDVVEVPEEIIGIVKCPNPKCITNNEEMKTKFNVFSKEGELYLKCRYCEKVYHHEAIRIILDK